MNLVKNPINTNDILQKLNIERSQLDTNIAGVYKIVCMENNKCYIGKSETNVYKRIIDNLKNVARYRDYKPKLHDDLFHFFPDQFEIEILAICPKASTATLLEELLISYEHSLNPGKLYNTNNYRYKWRVLHNLKPSELAKFEKIY